MKGTCIVCGESVSRDDVSAVDHLACIQSLIEKNTSLKGEYKRLCSLVGSLCEGIPHHIKNHIDLGKMLERQFIKESEEFLKNEERN